MRIKKISRIFAIAAVSVILSALFSISAFAMGNAEFTIPKNTATGKNFSVSLKVTADKDIGFVTAMITYDDTVAEFSPSDNASGGDGIINLKGFPDNASKELTFKLNFKALKSGTCRMNLTNCFVTSPDGDQIGSPTAYANVTVTGSGSNSNDSHNENSVSSNTDNKQPPQGYLKSLTVSEGVLKPDFSFDIYDYHVDVDENVEICEIEGETASDTDSIWYTGNENLIVGNNVRTIEVTDKDGNSHVYTITITRAGNPLSSEQIKDDSSSASLNTEISDSDDTDISANSDSSSLKAVTDDEDGLAKYRKILTPALIIILIALIIALVVLVIWLRKKKSEYRHEKKTNNRRKR